ncbi:hypothetical protein GINT2_000279 [Glugoides intestinalis]
MQFAIIPVSSLTEADLERRNQYHKRRNLYNKYTLEELENWIKIDLYEALDLDFYRDREIPMDALQYSVKRKSAIYHPTNNRGKQQAFLIIRKAETILTNQKYRKVYDSSFLDESLPEDREYSTEEFFNVFGDVFKRNALFSEIKPMPDLHGDPEIFYKFWMNFKTVRVYDDPADVFDIDGGTRRYNADKNKELMQKKKIKDLQRIQELMKLSIKRDPRIKKKSLETSPWKDNELQSLAKFDKLFGKVPNKFDAIAKKLNDLFLTKRSAAEVKSKLEQKNKK